MLKDLISEALDRVYLRVLKTELREIIEKTPKDRSVKFRKMAEIENVFRGLKVSPPRWFLEAVKADYDVSNFSEFEDVFYEKIAVLPDDVKEQIERLFYGLRIHFSEKRLSLETFRKAMFELEVATAFYHEISSEVAELVEYVPGLTGMQILLQDDEKTGLFGKTVPSLQETIMTSFPALEERLEDLSKKVGESEKGQYLEHGKRFLGFFKRLYQDLFSKVHEEAHLKNIRDGEYLKAILESFGSCLPGITPARREEFNWGELTYDPTGINSTRLKYDKGPYY